LSSRALNRFTRLATSGVDQLQSVSEKYRQRVAAAQVVPPATSDGITWFHSIDLGNGEVTPGIKPAATLANETLALNLSEDLSGHSALDIGAWDGYFSYELERRGADVVALDHYAWSTDHAAWARYHTEMARTGGVTKPPDEAPGVWDPVGLPGRAGFDYARKRLNSSIKPWVGDFMTMDLSTLGKFDVVLFLGVLYHLKDPFLALRRLREVTKGTAVIETASVTLPGWTDDRLWMFIESVELNDDASNWWTPTSAGLVAACRAAGFRDARVILESPEYAAPGDGYQLHYGRLTVHAYA
jgi:tRNA (mo5U34)-methyltransferase